MSLKDNSVFNTVVSENTYVNEVWFVVSVRDRAMTNNYKVDINNLVR